MGGKAAKREEGIRKRRQITEDFPGWLQLLIGPFTGFGNLDDDADTLETAKRHAHPIADVTRICRLAPVIEEAVQR